MSATDLTQLFATICYPPRSLETKPRPKARIIVEAYLDELDFVDDGEDFPEVFYDGKKIEVCEESMVLVGDEHEARRRGECAG